jgi:hypothetical protein
VQQALAVKELVDVFLSKLLAVLTAQSRRNSLCSAQQIDYERDFDCPFTPLSTFVNTH